MVAIAIGGCTKSQGCATCQLGLRAALKKLPRWVRGCGSPSLMWFPSLLWCFVRRRVSSAGTGSVCICWLRADSRGCTSLCLEDGPAAPVFLLPHRCPPRHLGKNILVPFRVMLARCIMGFSRAWTHFSWFRKIGREWSKQ